MRFLVPENARRKPGGRAEALPYKGEEVSGKLLTDRH